ncbi:hypothetical protein [Limimaricola cinnabarinus]|uniref:hypothetical protein n=1 Tax=Limimaricola cinnabarinus TaxID=1125964 RepID=UPI0039E3DC2A
MKIHVLGFALLAPVVAGAQVACLPPEEPYPFEPPQDDLELRQLVNEQYEAYVDRHRGLHQLP